MSNLELRRAAVILLSLPESEAALLLSRLEPAQVEAVAAEMARLGQFGGAEQEQTLRLFADAKLDSVAPEGRGLAITQRILEQALGNRAQETLANVRRRLEHTTFDFLENADDQTILAILRHERPQTIALVLAHMPVRRAAQLLQGLPDEQQGQMIRRIAALKPATIEILSAVQEALQRQLAATVAAGHPARAIAPSSASLPNVLESMNRQTPRWPLPLAS